MDATFAVEERPSPNAFRWKHASVGWTAVRVGFHAAAWGMWLGGLLFVMPRFAETFAGFDTTLPRITERVIILSMLAVDFPLGVLILFGVGGMIDVFVDRALSRGGRPLLRMAWFWILFLIPLALIFVGVVSIAMPIIDLESKLRGP